VTVPQDPARTARLDELVFAYLERVEDAPGRAAAALEELCAAEPDLAPELRRRVASLVGSGLWSPTGGGEGPMPERLGDFKLLRRLGQGGMGVVFLAEQQSVARRVALKLVKTDQLFQASARQRFLREAQAIARLDHPGIVGVLTVGEEAGLPYFAMEYVAGAPLDRLLDAWRGRAPESIRGEDVRSAIAAHLAAEPGSETIEWNEAAFRRGWVELALSIVRDVAEALHHAHQRGVLHRDVKPANVLMTPSGRVRLLDFGLAALSTSQSITRTGTMLGSLHYMPPEQVDGRNDEVGAASDVYSLGAMLYELLTLRVPYRGETHEAVRRAILDARPESLRARNPSVSIDVETVCLKALDKDVARRYESAAAFARDLENVLELRPIHARPPSTRTRIVRWTQRRPASAVALALGALLLVAGPIGYELSRARSEEALRTSAARSERDFQSALRSIGELLRETAVEDLEDVPRMQQARLSQLDRALGIHADLAAERPDDLRVIAEGGELRRARADVLRDLGRVEDSHADYAAAILLHRRALARDASVAQRRRLMAALVHAGKARTAQLELAAAQPLVDEGLELARANTAAEPDDMGHRGELVAALTARAERHSIAGDDAAARASIEEALALALDLRDADPLSPAGHWHVGRAHGWLTHLDERASDVAGRRAHAEASLAAFQRASELAPTKRFFTFELADAHIELAELEFELDPAGAGGLGDRHAELALGILDDLLRDFPDSARYRESKSVALEKLGISYARRGRADEARAMLESIAEERERAALSAPLRCDLALRAAMALNNVAASRIDANSGLDEGLEFLARAAALVERCPVVGGAATDARALDALIRYSRALTLLHLDRPAAACAAIAHHAEVVGSDPTRLRYASDLWNEYVLALDRVAASSGAENAAPPEVAREEAVLRMFELLDRAVDAGYREVDELRATPALAGFRDTPEYRALLDKLAPGR
jgi:serine/threonine protein kinase